MEKLREAQLQKDKEEENYSDEENEVFKLPQLKSTLSPTPVRGAKQQHKVKNDRYASSVDVLGD